MSVEVGFKPKNDPTSFVDLGIGQFTIASTWSFDSVIPKDDCQMIYAVFQMNTWMLVVFRPH